VDEARVVDLEGLALHSLGPIALHQLGLEAMQVRDPLATQQPIQARTAGRRVEEFPNHRQQIVQGQQSVRRSSTASTSWASVSVVRS